MIVYNNICETCRNMDICSIWKNIKKFSEDYAKNPYPTDIEIKDCRNFVEIDDSEDLICKKREVPANKIALTITVRNDGICHSVQIELNLVFSSNASIVISFRHNQFGIEEKPSQTHSLIDRR